jgi:hypothetical protein
MKQKSYSLDPLDWIGAFVLWVTAQVEALVRGVAYLLSGDVVVGFASHLDPDQRHGTAFFETPSGRTDLPFKVDRPENLDQPSRTTIESIFAQIENMGQRANEIEIITACETRVYRNGEAKPIFVQRH